MSYRGNHPKLRFPKHSHIASPERHTTAFRAVRDFTHSRCVELLSLKSIRGAAVSASKRIEFSPFRMRADGSPAERDRSCGRAAHDLPPSRARTLAVQARRGSGFSESTCVPKLDTNAVRHGGYTLISQNWSAGAYDPNIGLSRSGKTFFACHGLGCFNYSSALSRLRLSRPNSMTYPWLPCGGFTVRQSLGNLHPNSHYLFLRPCQFP